MGTTCCGYSLGNRGTIVSNPQELQNNINECIEINKKSLIKRDYEEKPTNKNDITKKNQNKEKYDGFEANGEGLESSNLPSQDNNNYQGNPPNNNENNNNNSQIIQKSPEKNRTKEFNEETLPESNAHKLHIDLSAAGNSESQQQQTSQTKEKGQKSPKRTTNIVVKKERKNHQQVINLQEIKLSEETNKKLTLLKEKSEKSIQGGVKSPNAFQRSKTINANALGELVNNESELYEQSERTKKIEEIKKEFLEDRKKLEKKQSEKNLHKKPSGRAINRSIKNDHNNHETHSPANENADNWKQEEMKRLGSLSPKKSLLKRAKTIGEELKGDKNKKKVKFKDLDNKGKKKRR